MTLWHIPPLWEGERVFVIGGGTSVRSQNIEQLRGHRVVVINTSYEVAPFADLLFFADTRWWHAHREKLKSFKGMIATTSASLQSEPRLLRLRKVRPLEHDEGLHTTPGHVIIQRTGLQAVFNILFHMRVKTIVLVGFDMQRDEQGKAHHHAPHEWDVKPGNRTWDIQMKQLAIMVEPLRQAGIEVLNASPNSRLAFWPRVTLEDAIWGSYAPDCLFYPYGKHVA